MPDENRVFDVAKPGHASPQATSKPVIVGHQPTMSDPMVKGDEPNDTEPTRIMVHDENRLPTPEEPADLGAPAIMEPKDDLPAENNMEALADQPLIPMPDEPKPDFESASEHQSPFETHETTDTSVHETSAPDPDQLPDTPPDDAPIEPIGHVEGLHVSPPRRRLSLKWVSLVILLLIAGAYLAIDDGLIGSSINLPFHVFKQKSETPATSAPTASQNQSNANTVTVPAGFTEYKLAGTAITFAAPTAWGQPTSNTDPGFTNRSTNAKSTGTYAYIVDFATNKDVQVAVTSSKLLPTTRSTLYYDFLQWCTGTSDGKVYLSILHFSTANKVDTPTTVACDQGPLTDATKQDATTIVELKAKDVNGGVLGDIYTKNLNSTDLPVFRVKDKAMASSADIKTLLSTVKSPNGTATTQ
ncbi:hypothetical protein KW801_02595 [Candidatus Saccharibacteria bacterium]|nr:hypothetical protein [Candidatus Saccharibacteria bacterium]